jgi:hypothetical protein
VVVWTVDGCSGGSTMRLFHLSTARPYDIQEGPAWGCDGPCVEPMFRSLARLDWIRARRLQDDPADTWPIGHFGGEGQPPSLEVLGFDPYRFDHARMAQVIRCVLGEHCGLPTGGR